MSKKIFVIFVLVGVVLIGAMGWFYFSKEKKSSTEESASSANYFNRFNKEECEAKSGGLGCSNICKTYLQLEEASKLRLKAEFSDFKDCDDPKIAESGVWELNTGASPL